MDGDRVVAAVARCLVRPGLEVTGRRDLPDGLLFESGRYLYEAEPASWVVATEPWVADAVRVTADPATDGGGVLTYGFLFERDGADLFLNDVATMRSLGARLGAGIEPLAYAELLAEFYSGPNIDRPIVPALAVAAGFRAGELVSDVDAFTRKYPYIDPALVAPPSVRREDDGMEIEFRSCYHRFAPGAVDILRWSVRGGGGRPVSWSREYVAERIEHPGP